MADQLYRVELTAGFLERLDAIEVFLVEADAGFAFDTLLVELRATVIPNLRRFPRIGRRYLVPDRKVMFSEIPMALTCLRLCCRGAELETSGSSDASNIQLPPIRRCSDGSISAPALAATEESRIKVV